MNGPQEPLSRNQRTVIKILRERETLIRREAIAPYRAALSEIYASSGGYLIREKILRVCNRHGIFLSEFGK